MEIGEFENITFHEQFRFFFVSSIENQAQMLSYHGTRSLYSSINATLCCCCWKDISNSRTRPKVLISSILFDRPYLPDLMAVLHVISTEPEKLDQLSTNSGQSANVFDVASTQNLGATVVYSRNWIEFNS